MSLLSLGWGALALVVRPGRVMAGTGLAFVPLLVGFVGWWLPALRARGGLDQQGPLARRPA